MRWFVGGMTSAAFNGSDRHVLSGHGDETAFMNEPDDAERVRLMTRWLLLAADDAYRLCRLAQRRALGDGR